MRDTDRPVVVEMAQLVRQPLHVVRLHTGRVHDHVVGGRGHSALTHRLTHDEEVIPEQTKSLC